MKKALITLLILSATSNLTASSFFKLIKRYPLISESFELIKRYPLSASGLSSALFYGAIAATPHGKQLIVDTCESVQETVDATPVATENKLIEAASLRAFPSRFTKLSASKIAHALEPVVKNDTQRILAATTVGLAYGALSGVAYVGAVRGYKSCARVLNRPIHFK